MFHHDHSPRLSAQLSLCPVTSYACRPPESSGLSAAGGHQAKILSSVSVFVKLRGFDSVCEVRRPTLSYNPSCPWPVRCLWPAVLALPDM